MPHADFHRKVIHAIALLMFGVCSFVVVGTLLVPQTTPLLDKVVVVDIPLQYQRALVVLLGASGLVGSLLLLSFKPIAWWLLIATGVFGVIHGLTSVPVFLPTAVNLFYVIYLFSVRPLFFADSKASPAARSR